jgi:hypothetical protein
MVGPTMMIGPQRYWKEGWARFRKGDRWLPAFSNRLAITGNAPAPRPEKAYPCHFNNRCKGGGMGRRNVRLRSGRVWLASKPHTFCAACGVLCGPEFTSYIPDALRTPGYVYGWLPRVCSACYEKGALPAQAG